MRLALLTLLTMIAFAANSVLNRLGVAGGQIGAAEFAAVRRLSGAGMLLALVGLRAALRGTAIWPGGRGRLVGPLSLLVYLFGFSWAYRSLPAGAGALILFGTVQITMFAGALLGREAVPGARWAGAGLAFSGLCLLLVPGGAEVSLPHAAAMALAGAGWGVFSLSGRGQTDALGATAWNFGLALPLGLALAAGRQFASARGADAALCGCGGAGAGRGRAGRAGATLSGSGRRADFPCILGHPALCRAGYILSVDLLFPRGFSSRS